MIEALGKHDSSKFKESHREDPAIGEDMEGGWRISRPRYTRRVPRVFTLGFTDISDTDKQAIEQLFHDMRGSAGIIADWIHPVSGEVLDVRFKSGSVPGYDYKGRGGNHRWDISGIVLEEV